MFSTPQVKVYSQGVRRSVEFYRAFGFEETFRTPREGDPIHVELVLDRFKVGVVDWLGTLRLPWVADPDGNPIELAERRS